MAKAMWHGKVIAESPEFEIVEGNVYFPPGTIDKRYFKDSPTTSQCHWKGTAHYFTVAVEGAENKDAAWYYPEPLPAAKQIKDFVAFWKGVEVER
ncbi:MAG TPA: DUF427 domain-containing protein [Stellaceae bacterium]